MRPLSSRWKIALLSAATSGLVLIVFGAFLWFMVHKQRVEASDREIRSFGMRHPGLFANRGNFERFASSLEFTFGADYTNHVIMSLKDAQGQTLYLSPHWPKVLDLSSPDFKLDVAPPMAGASFAVSNSPVAPVVDSEAGPGRGGGGWGRGFGGMGRGPGPRGAVVFNRAPRFLTLRTAESAWRIGVLGNDELTLVLGLNYKETQRELNHLRDRFLLTLPLALFLVGLGGWVVAGRALAPLNVIAETAEHVTARGLDQRIPESTEGPEAQRVIKVLNRMIDRLEASFRQATRFTADASHELKTPLAVMQGELENALHAAKPGSPEQELFNNLLEETQRLKTITRSLLLLAQADAGQLKLRLERVDLSAELKEMIEDAQMLAAELNLKFEVEAPPELGAQADRALLHTAWFNLIANAVKYNEPGGRVLIRLGSENGQVCLTIGNSGKGIPSAEQARVFERFHRAGQESGPRIEGIGLGLSLAREIVRAHGGELVLKESRVGWTEFEAKLRGVSS
jgi:heavy metal sensor kinase